MTEAIIETKALVKTFHKGKNNEVSPVKDINLSIERNSCVLLKGASGSGKTTLLTLLACLSKPTSGQYHCLGQQVSRWSEKFLTGFRRTHIGVVFQHFNLISGFNTYLNISLPLIPLHYSRKKTDRLVQSVAESVGIAHRLDFSVDTLSGGEMQRVAIARALVNEPTILLADEPTAHLDSERSLQILDIFQEIKHQGKTILITSHDPLVEQHPMIDRVLVMKDGKMAEG